MLRTWNLYLFPAWNPHPSVVLKTPVRAASNKNQEIFSDSHHITLLRKHDRFIIWTHLGWNYKWELGREISWEYFGLNRRMVLYSINWDWWFCDMCHALWSRLPLISGLHWGGRNKGKRKGKKATPRPLPSPPPCHQHMHIPMAWRVLRPWLYPQES